MTSTVFKESPTDSQTSYWSVPLKFHTINSGGTADNYIQRGWPRFRTDDNSIFKRFGAWYVAQREIKNSSKLHLIKFPSHIFIYTSQGYSQYRIKKALLDMCTRKNPWKVLLNLQNLSSNTREGKTPDYIKPKVFFKKQINHLHFQQYITGTQLPHERG